MHYILIRFFSFCYKMSQNHKEPEEIDLTINSDEKDTDEG
jgi:hypothetical protein